MLAPWSIFFIHRNLLIRTFFDPFLDFKCDAGRFSPVFVAKPYFSPKGPIPTKYNQHLWIFFLANICPLSPLQLEPAWFGVKTAMILQST